MVGVEMLVNTFEIIFHGPITIATGEPSDNGADIAVNPADPIPGSSIKGVLRANALVLGCNESLIDEVFGFQTTKSKDRPNLGNRINNGSDASPWWFSSANNHEWAGARIKERARVKIDPKTGIAADRGLFSVDEAWLHKARFTIEQHSYIDPERKAIHQNLLLVAALATHSLGSSRRRGSGWVTINRVTPPTPEELQLAISNVREANYA